MAAKRVGVHRQQTVAAFGGAERRDFALVEERFLTCARVSAFRLHFLRVESTFTRAHVRAPWPAAASRKRRRQEAGSSSQTHRYRCGFLFLRVYRVQAMWWCRLRARMCGVLVARCDNCVPRPRCMADFYDDGRPRPKWNASPHTWQKHGPQVSLPFPSSFLVSRSSPLLRVALTR